MGDGSSDEGEREDGYVNKARAKSWPCQAVRDGMCGEYRKTKVDCEKEYRQYIGNWELNFWESFSVRGLRYFIIMGGEWQSVYSI